MDHTPTTDKRMDGSVQDCSNSIANILELLHSCTEPSDYDTQISLQAFIHYKTVSLYLRYYTWIQTICTLQITSEAMGFHSEIQSLT